MVYDARVNVSVTGTQQLEKLQQALNKTSTMFGGLRTKLAAIGFGAFARSALTLADDLQDLSNATGIATGRLVELKDALVANGGQADQMAQGVTTFTRSIDEAAQGSLKAQNSFQQLGISLNDLRTLGEQELMLRTLEGIAAIEDPSRRAALMMDKFGKSFRTVDPAGMAASLRASAGSGDAYAESIRKAAKLNDDLALAFTNFKLIVLNAFGPAIDQFNKFADALRNNKDLAAQVTTAVQALGIVMASVFGGSLLLGFVRVLGTVGRGLAAIASFSGFTTLGAGMASVFAVSGKLLVGFRAIAVLLSAGLGIFAATKLFDDFGSVVSNVASRVIEGIGEIAASILNLEPLTGIINALFGTNLDFSNAAGRAVQNLVDRAREHRLKVEEAAAATKGLKDETKKVGDEAANVTNRIVDRTQYDQAVANIRSMGDEFQKNNDKIRERLTLDAQVLGLSKQDADLMRQRNDLVQRSSEEINKLNDAKAKMSKDEKEAGLGAIYDEQIAKIRELTLAESERLRLAIEGAAKLEAVQQLNLFATKSRIDGENELMDIQDRIAKSTMSEIEQKYYDIERAAQKSAKAAIEAEEARIGRRLTGDEAAEYQRIASARTSQIKELTRQEYEASRSFSTGWTKAFNEYADNATNAAKNAENIFRTVTSGMEDMIVNFAKTGKFEWKNFVASIAETLLRSQIQQLIANIFNTSLFKPNAGGGATGGGLLGGIADLIGGMFRANGGPVTGNQPYIVGERGPELFVPGASGRVISNNDLASAAPAAGNQVVNVTYNINAVDAPSFQALVARDPAFIHAVATQGGRSLPMGRR